MPLDPQVKKFIEILEKTGMPDLRKTPTSKLREYFDVSAVLPPKVGIRTVRDLDLKNGNWSVKARIYDDDNSDGAIIYFHGGGFFFGNIETHDAVCRNIAKYSKTKVISVDYRLAPENKFPAAADDAFNSYRYFLENAESFNISKNRIAVMGDSAGGNLAAVASLMARDKGVKVPKLQVLVYPVVAPDAFSRSYVEYGNLFLTRELMAWFSQQYIESPADLFNPYFSPALSPDLCGLPETIMITAEYDPLRDQGESFASMLRENDIPVTSIRANGLIHGFLSNFHIFDSAYNVLKVISAIAGEKLRSEEP